MVGRFLTAVHNSLRTAVRVKSPAKRVLNWEAGQVEYGKADERTGGGGGGES